MLAKEKDLAKQKLLSKPAKAAETTETVEAVVQKSLTKNRQNIQRTSLPNDKSKTAKGSPSIKTLFQKGPGKTKASHQSKSQKVSKKRYSRVSNRVNKYSLGTLIHAVKTPQTTQKEG